MGLWFLQLGLWFCKMWFAWTKPRLKNTGHIMNQIHSAEEGWKSKVERSMGIDWSWKNGPNEIGSKSFTITGHQKSHGPLPKLPPAPILATAPAPNASNHRHLSPCPSYHSDHSNNMQNCMRRKLQQTHMLLALDVSDASKDSPHPWRSGNHMQNCGQLAL